VKPTFRSGTEILIVNNMNLNLNDTIIGKEEHCSGKTR
jgi:hypothetical protein